MGCGGGAGAGVAIRLTNGQIHIFALPFGIFQQSFREIPCAMHDTFDSQRITFHVNPGSCDGAGVLADAIHDRGVIPLVWRMNAFEDCRFQCGRFVELLPFKNAQSLADHLAFVGVTTRVDKTIHKLIQRGRKDNCHGRDLVRP